MKVILDIPGYKFADDIEDKFQDYFERVKADIYADGTVCGNYELEITDMFLASFKRMQILPDNMTNGDVIRNMFGEPAKESNAGVLYKFKYRNGKPMFSTYFDFEWWNAPYKKGNENGSNKRYGDA